MTARCKLEPFRWAGGIECTFVPHGTGTRRPLDEYQLTGHYDAWKEDLDRAASLGIKALRWAVPWFKVEVAMDNFDWSWVDLVIDHAGKLKLPLIVDLMHYTTPLWLEHDVCDSRYVERVAIFARTLALRYKGKVRHFTVHNEPMVGADFGGRRGEWPPYLLGEQGYVKVLIQNALGMQASIRAIKNVIPQAVFVSADSMRLYRPDTADRGCVRAAKKLFLHHILPWDLVRGAVNENHPLYRYLISNGASEEALLQLQRHAVRQHVFGINFYPWSVFAVKYDGNRRYRYVEAETHGRDLADVIKQTHKHVQAPIWITETSHAGTTTEKMLWMSETIDAVRVCRNALIPVVGYTWFPLTTMVDWAYRNDNKPATDWLLPLGLWDIHSQADGTMTRVETPLVESYRDWVRRGI